MPDIECNILFSKNRTLFNLDIGWEGIPFNITSNLLICSTLIVILVLIRWRNDKTLNDPKKNSDWLHFIFDDRVTNDLKAAKFKLINRKHRLAYLPPILHDYQHLITDKLEERTVEDLPFYKHVSKEDDIIYKDSFEELPTIRSEMEFQGITESKINEMYSGFDIEKYESREEALEVDKLKNELLENYVHDKIILKKKLEEPDKTRALLKLIGSYLWIRDEEIIKNKGSDALQYLLFQRYLIYFMTFMTIICLMILLPINMQGNSQPDINKFSKTTVSNLGKGSKLTWVHSFMTLMTVAMGVYMMNHFSKLNTVGVQGIDRKILLIQNIPESKRKTSFLLNFFKEKFPKVVIKRITFVYDTRNLEKIKNDLLITIEAKKYCNQYQQIYQSKIEVRPYCFGRFGGFLCCCSCCPKVDGVRHYAENKAELKNDIIIEAENLLYKPIGSAFVVFEKRWMAKEVYTSFKGFNHKNLVIWFNAIKSIFVSMSDDMKSYLWRVSYAPFPEDIEWKDIVINRNYQRLWSVLMHSLLMFIFLFLSTPSTAAELVLFFTKRTSELRVLSQFVKPYLLIIMTVFLPSLVLIVQYQIPYTTRSALNHALMFKSYVFMIFMVLILPPLNTYTAAVFVDALLTEKREGNVTQSPIDWNCLFPTGNSGFFMHYIISSAFIGNIFELFRVSELCSYIIYMFIISQSVAEYESARQKIPFSFPFGIKYARILLIFTIMVTYSISSPLVAPAGLLYLVIKHLVDRYNLYYVYNPTQLSTGMHSTAVITVHITLFFLLIQVSTTLSQFEDTLDNSLVKPSTLTYFVLLIFFLMLLWKVLRYFYENDI